MMPWDEPGGSERCARCKAARMLCGKERCPIIIRHYSLQKTLPLLDSTHLEGASPPSVFVGRMGYPRVYVGPMIPPVHGDTSILDLPEQWIGKSIEEIAEMRFQLVRGKHHVNVHDVESPDSIVQSTREIVLAKQSAETEAVFTKKPTGRVVSDDEIQPYGPSALLERLKVGSYHTDHKVEKAFYDTDLKSAQAVLELYEKGVLVSKIQRAFSVGAFGLGKNRKFVPTRWSITAVDSTISKVLMQKTRRAPIINEPRAYYFENLDNRWLVMMLPRPWSYELIEAWYPGTTWNPGGQETVILEDCEGFHGRTKYAEIGGCYYSARLGVNEKLNEEKRQATTLVWRETHPGYVMPVGVWNVRESVREALKTRPTKFANTAELLSYAASKFEIPIQKWVRRSTILRNALSQKTLNEF